MPMPDSLYPATNHPLTQQELDHLAEVREVWTTTKSAGWQRVMGQVSAFVEESYEAMVGNCSSDPMSYMRLQLRWQQRLAMKRGIEKYVSDCEFQRQQLLSEAREPTYSVPVVEEYAEQD